MNASLTPPHEAAMNSGAYGQSVLSSPAWADALIGAIEGAKETERQRRLAEARATELAESIEGDAA